jgi:class 3 adenylate cyclase
MAGLSRRRRPSLTGRTAANRLVIRDGPEETQPLRLTRAEASRKLRHIIVCGHTLGFGIGLAKGIATVGRIGYEGRSDYTAIGNVVNLAARMCSAAEDGQILIDAAAANEIGAAIPLTSLGTRSLRGFSEPVPVFSVALQESAAATKEPLDRATL